MSTTFEMLNRAHNVLNEAPADKCEVEKQFFNGINLDNISDKGIKLHLSAYVTALHDIDVAGLKTAYHVAAIKPLLNGNTSGLQTDFVKFCKNTLNIGKAQAYNMLLAGNMVVMLYDEKGKNPIYTDCFTAHICDGDYKAIKKRKCFGQTQLVYLGRLSKKYDLSIDTICELIEKGAITPALSVKAIDKYISGIYISEKPTDEKPTDEKPTDEKPTDDKSDTKGNKTYTKEQIERILHCLGTALFDLDTSIDGNDIRYNAINEVIAIIKGETT